MKMADTIETFLYNPIVLVLLTPLSYLLVGTIYASQYVDLSFSKLIAFYLLLFVNYGMENYLKKHSLLNKSELKGPFFLLELMNILLIIYISLQSHYSIGLLIILYSLAIHFQHALKVNQFPIIAVLILGIFKGGILTYLSFFIQAHFLPLVLIFWSVPLIILHLFLETGTYLLEKNSPNVAPGQSYFLLTLMILVYLSTFLFLYSTFTIWLLLFILTFPFAIRLAKVFISHKWKDSKPITLKTYRLYQLSYVFIFAIAEILYFVNLWSLSFTIFLLQKSKNSNKLNEKNPLEFGFIP